MRSLIATVGVFLCASPALFAVSSVGSGSPSPQVQQSFIAAFNRGAFSRLVVLPPPKDVTAFGTPGLVQEFSAKSDSTVYALVMPDPGATPDVLATWQVSGSLYAYYKSVGVNSAGYPTIDTAVCPANAFGACNYQLFSSNYALFVYPGTPGNLTVKDPFYTEWINQGGVAVFGAAIGSETAVTSVSAVLGTEQQFGAGTIFSYPVGSKTPSVFSIPEPFNTAFNMAGAYGQLGFPTSDPITLSSGLVRQTFEHGRIELAAGQTPVVLFSLQFLSITGQSQGLTLALGASATLSAVASDTTSQPITGRALSWTTSNGSVARVTGNGDTATVLAVGPGTANIYVSGEGKTSLPLLIRVGSTCCGVGEGAPTAAITQAFQAAATRNNLKLNLPAASQVVRAGNGYVQEFTSSDGTASSYTLAQGDGSGSAFVLTGAVRAAYLANGGFTGTLGYPASDPITGGAQKFTSGAALGGTPVRVIPAIIASKWFQLGGPGAAAGSPVADAVGFVSSSGFTGLTQAFANGAIYALASGPKTGQAFLVTGAILARYSVLSGPAGIMGLPLGDAVSNGGVLTQNFEAGYIDLQPGAGVAVEHLNPRHPAVSLSATSVIPGSRIHIGVTGFAPGATLSFTITGQPGFSVNTSFGAFAWDFVVPSGAKPGAVSIQVTSPGSSDSASASYVVTSLAASVPRLTVVSGDRQTGLPGSSLPMPIIAVLQDSAGNPLPGVPVSFSGSPGAIAQVSSLTDQNGQVAVNFRLPPASGVAVGSLTAAAEVVTFSAIAAANTIQNFPAFTEVDAQGALAASLAALIRYSQNLGTLPAPNGLATPALLNSYAASKGGIVLAGTPDSVINPWIATQFGAGSLSIEDPSPDHVRDLLTAGVPVAILLNVSVNGGLYGGDTVDAVGVGPDGSILIDDPNPAFGRTSLADFVNGFTAQGNRVQGTVAAVLRVNPAPVVAGAAAPFTVASPIGAAVAISSPAGPCPLVNVLSSGSSVGQRFHYCDGTQNTYEIDFGAAGTASVSDLAGGGAESITAAKAGSWSLTTNGGQKMVSSQTLAITAVTDAAAFSTGLAPGGLIAIFGSGFGSVAPTVTLDGRKISVIAAFPFQVNAQIPADQAPGSAVLQVTGPLGTASRTIAVVAAAPEIFMIGSQGAIVNQAGTINSPAAPAQRGQFISIYCTGLGATTVKSGFQTVNLPVTITINGGTATPSFAGLVVGYPGLYQINVTVPAGIAPNNAGTLTVQESGRTSNPVGFALQ